MKKIIILLALVTMLFTSCAHDKTINGVKYETYGLANQDKVKCDSIHYKVSVGNFVWSVLLSSTIVVPVYFIGWDLFEPVGTQNEYHHNIK